MRSSGSVCETSPRNKFLLPPVSNRRLQHYVSPMDTSIQQQSSPAMLSQRLIDLDEEFHSPFEGDGAANYIIIPLLTANKTPPNQRCREGSEDLMESRNIKCTLNFDLDSNEKPQIYHRSPEKRFYSPGPICRICHEDDSEEELITPCDCNGSLQFVHKNCLERWLTGSNIDVCEICHFRFSVVREARSLWQWLKMPSSPDGPNGFYADMCCVLLLTPLCMVSVYLCGLGAAEYLKQGIWEGIGLAVLSIFLLSTYVLWFYVTVRFHFKIMARWKEHHQVIHLVDRKCRRQVTSNNASPMNTVVVAGMNGQSVTQVVQPQFAHFQPSTI